MKNEAEEDKREKVAKTLKSARAVLFDVDSTLSLDEGIDELADWLGKKAEVEALTSKAMDGDLAFEDALHQRLHVRLLIPSSSLHPR